MTAPAVRHRLADSADRWWNQPVKVRTTYRQDGTAVHELNDPDLLHGLRTGCRVPGCSGRVTLDPATTRCRPPSITGMLSFVQAGHPPEQVALALLTRPQDWSPRSRAILWPELR